MARPAKPTTTPSLRAGSFWRRAEYQVARAAATVGFSGYFPFASGTVGSAVVALILWQIGTLPLWTQLVGAALLLALAFWSTGVFIFDREEKDASCVVVDEAIGMWIAVLGIPWTPYWLLAGFLLFRVFDIVKLPPSDYFDRRWKNRWGVVLDDVFAGLYANVALQLVWHSSLGGFGGPFR